MPTQTLFQLMVEGPAPELAAFRDDDGLWACEPWSQLFAAELVTTEGRKLVYRFADDYKRPSPDVGTFAAAHPALRFILECCDEFGTIGGRATFEGGKRVKEEEVEPIELEWIEWEGDEE